MARIGKPSKVAQKKQQKPKEKKVEEKFEEIPKQDSQKIEKAEKEIVQKAEKEIVKKAEKKIVKKAEKKNVKKAEKKNEKSQIIEKKEEKKVEEKEVEEKKPTTSVIHSIQPIKITEEEWNKIHTPEEMKNNPFLQGEKKSSKSVKPSKSKDSKKKNAKDMEEDLELDSLDEEDDEKDDKKDEEPKFKIVKEQDAVSNRPELAKMPVTCRKVVMDQILRTRKAELRLVFHGLNNVPVEAFNLNIEPTHFHFDSLKSKRHPFFAEEYYYGNVKVDENSAKTVLKKGNLLIILLKVIEVPEETLEKEKKTIESKETSKSMRFPATQAKKVFLLNDAKAKKSEEKKRKRNQEKFDAMEDETERKRRKIESNKAKNLKKKLKKQQKEQAKTSSNEEQAKTSSNEQAKSSEEKKE